MSKSAKFGGVQVQLNEDGTLFVYQPDANRLLSPGLGRQLASWLTDVQHVNGVDPDDDEDDRELSSTVLNGVIATSDGPVDRKAILARMTAEAPAEGGDEFVNTRTRESVELDEMTAAAEAEGMASPPEPAIPTESSREGSDATRGTDKPAPVKRRPPGRPRKRQP